MTYEEAVLYFKYYEYCENLFFESEKYLFICQANKDAFSIHFCSLLGSICSDFESLGKKFFGLEEIIKIDKLVDHFMEAVPFQAMLEEEISLNGTDYEHFKPFVLIGKSFTWWLTNNDLKHEKFDKIQFATQEKVVHALGALYTLNRYVLKTLSIGSQNPDIFLNHHPHFALTKLKNNDSALSGDWFVERKN